MEETVTSAWSGKQWLEALGNHGSERAVAELALHRMLRQGLQRALASRPSALGWVDDFAQEATLRVLAQLSTFSGRSKFSTWAFAIAIRVAFDELRRKRWRDISLEQLVDANGDTHLRIRDRQDKERALAREQILGALREAMNQHLSKRQNTALTAELAGMPQAEIARRMASNRNAIYKLTHDARLRLKEVLTRDGVTSETIAWAFAAPDQGVI